MPLVLNNRCFTSLPIVTVLLFFFHWWYSWHFIHESVFRSANLCLILYGFLLGVARFVADVVYLLASTYFTSLIAENPFFWDLKLCLCVCGYRLSKCRGVLIFKNPRGLYTVVYEGALIIPASGATHKTKRRRISWSQICQFLSCNVGELQPPPSLPAPQNYQALLWKHRS